ncbi:SPASM domain-containing protein [Acidocella sp.]|jgi:MoaA/NifB/PqqE/SkfB family radical SAM enzyme|uniref:SPASM domain-containing protein n=1 Tax=Acidocella sp. TaxID=50710 RepID=UPI002F417A9F
MNWVQRRVQRGRGQIDRTFMAMIDRVLGSNVPDAEMAVGPAGDKADGGVEFDQFVNDAFWHYHRNYKEHDYLETFFGFSLTKRPNDVSRHVTALERFLRRTPGYLQRGGSFDQVLCLQVLREIDKQFHNDRIPMIVAAKTSLEHGQPWEAFEFIVRALEFDPYCEMSMAVLWKTLRDLPCPDQWRGFFDRSTPPAVGALSYTVESTELFDYFIEFCRAVMSCGSLDNEASCQAVRMFYHRWWKVYRHEDSAIGRFAAYGNSDQSQPIAALRQVLEFACYRTLSKMTDKVEVGGERWNKTCCDLTLALESQVPEIPVFLLAAEYLARLGRLDEARDRGYRSFNMNSRCLITQHLLDCVEHAIEMRAQTGSVAFSLLEEAPRRFAGRFCPVPFDEAYINPDGDTFLCCAAILPVPIGNVFREKSWDDIWNSKTAQEIRGSILDGTYKYCNKRSCPTILNNALMQSTSLLNEDTKEFRRARWRQAIANQDVRIDGALFSDLGYDISCNLSCPQCRLDLIVLDKPGYARLDNLREGMIDDLLGKLRNVRISSGGEALFSRHFRALLADISPQRCPNLTHMELLTNGMLFDRRQWDTFKNIHYLKINLVVSIDASSKQTFESIRRKGRWERMVANLEFARELRETGRLTKFTISYAVQTENFHDMPRLVEMAERLHVDEIAFFKLENVGTYSEDEYRQRNIAEPSHPLHSEFLDVLRDPIFASPIVAAHNLGPFMAALHGPRKAREVIASDPYWGDLYA